jgi:phage baseplate assembly protein W|tara:strand:- start:150 stop:578 length:429 start_codon:yes stop_codon:yes gene_type:complete
MAIYDAQLNNNSERNARQYTDLDLFFTKRASDNDVGVITDIQAVKRSIRNLVQLDHYDKPFHPEIGSGVRQMLFELMTPITSVILARKIEDVINNFEPRAVLQAVTVIPDFDRNAYEVKIEFYVVNTPTELVDMSVLLERLR